MEWIKQQWNRFYDYFIANVSSGIKAAVIVGMLVLAIMFVLAALNGKSDIVFKKWFPLFMAILLIVLTIVYMYLTR